MRDPQAADTALIAKLPRCPEFEKLKRAIHISLFFKGQAVQQLFVVCQFGKYLSIKRIKFFPVGLE